MKRIICMLLMLCLIVSTLCCCAKASEPELDNIPEPEFNLDKAVDNLEAAGYHVSYAEPSPLLHDLHIVVSTRHPDPYIKVLEIYFAPNAENLYQQVVSMHIRRLVEESEYLKVAQQLCIATNNASWSVAHLKECEARLSAYERMVIGYDDYHVWIGTPEAIEDSRG
jgi:hypothetical protein